jgi:hypothetical protein
MSHSEIDETNVLKEITPFGVLSTLEGENNVTES